MLKYKKYFHYQQEEIRLQMMCHLRMFFHANYNHNSLYI